ncbi:MAG TPA: endonuclease/exonuclease/phosphatase family protein [Polyangiaceae bacterium]|nr:endonuclease/exonuclease/phosphatase family protein [Polyangiaceae bacterium]
MTYNVHSFLGTDSVYDPDRTAAVIVDSGAEIVALQEVDFGRGARAEPSAIERLARRLGMSVHFTFTRDGKNGHFGNAVLSKHDLQLVAEGPLPRRRDEARAVQLLQVAAGNLQFHLINTHLSVSGRERKLQVQALLGAEWVAKAGTDLPLVICGDFNASPFSGVYRKLTQSLLDVQGGLFASRGTWPSRFPFWRIDHMFVSPSIAVQRCVVLDRRAARTASDHLPLLAELVFDTR